MTEVTDTEKKPTLDEEIDSLSHEDLLEITESSLKRLITSDPLLNDLPVDVTVEEVLAQIAVAQGQSITVTVIRYSESPLSVVVSIHFHLVKIIFTQSKQFNYFMLWVFTAQENCCHYIFITISNFNNTNWFTKKEYM